MAFLYGTLYRELFLCFALFKLLTICITVFLTTIPSIFEGIYHQKPGIAGLNYLALGVGLSGASQINARMLDRVYKYHASKNENSGKPEYRLRLWSSGFSISTQLKLTENVAPMFVGTILLPIGLLIAGWTVEAKTHWIGPDIVRSDSSFIPVTHLMLRYRFRVLRWWGREQ
jgi:hypothetical protein